jgi:hypothetical protein
MFDHWRSKLAVAAMAVPLFGAGVSPAQASPPGGAAPANAIPRFDPKQFSNSTHIDNPWFPLVPGQRYVFRGVADFGNGLKPHLEIFTVTDLTKVIGGVRALVIWDRDYSAGQLVEAELAFFAQDDAGNVWELGEYPEEYVHGQFDGAPDAWINGLRKARAGIAMLADPRVGTPSYSEGWAPAVQFADRGQVFATGQQVCVPAGCYSGVLVIDEWDASDPSGGHQRKFYATGVGQVHVAPVGGDQETLDLAKSVVLGAAGMDEARETARFMDRRGHRVNPMYAKTLPLERLH